MKPIIKSLAAVCLLGTSASAITIYNGMPESGPRFAGVGQILRSDTHPLGTATLISRNVILTAAQCFIDTSPDPVFQFALDENRQAKVSGFVRHPEYEVGSGPNFVYDIALGVLDKTQTRRWGDVARSAVRTTHVPGGTLGVGVGFGETSNGAGAGERTSGILHVNGDVAGSGTFGELIVDAFVEVSPGNGLGQMFCVPGDVGGPLYVDGEIAGVASSTDHFFCGDPGQGYCVPTDRLAAWIASTLNDIDPPGACDCNDNGAFATRDGGCEDLATGVVWSKPIKGFLHTDAASYAAALVEAGRSDWRLPTVAEAQRMDSNGGAQGCIDAPKTIWTSEVSGSSASVWSFVRHGAQLTPLTEQHGCIAVRSAP